MSDAGPVAQLSRLTDLSVILETSMAGSRPTHADQARMIYTTWREQLPLRADLEDTAARWSAKIFWFQRIKVTKKQRVHLAAPLQADTLCD